MKKIKILAICGKAGAGKDTLLRLIVDNFKIHEIISCTTRPMREGEKEGINYYYLTKEDFTKKVMNDEMLECTEFNNWFYGTMKQGLDLEGWNIGVFNPEGIEVLEDNPDVDVRTIYIDVPGKERLIRQLNREENPNIDEIIRRYYADERDFRFLADRFSYYMINNIEKSDLINSAWLIAEMCGIEETKLDNLS